MKILTFGEIMLRFKPPAFARLVQANSFEASYGGAEANVAVSLSIFHDDAAYLTKLPENPLGEAALGTLRRFGVDTGRVLRGGPRLGTYYFEKGTSIRPTRVVYDRAGSSIATARRSEFDWPALLKGVDIFYFSGITPAISDELAGAVKDALTYCKSRGITVVSDLNYRGKMWTPEKARSVMRGLMPYIDICLANDEDFEAALGIRAFDGDMSRGIEQINSFRAGMKKITEEFPNCKAVASILRNIHSVEESDWMGILLRDGKFYESPVHSVHVMEGVASGDAFGAGLIHGLLHFKDPQESIDFAIAASVLKLMIGGDLNLVTEDEVRAAMRKGGSARVSR
ncbi:MAG TPA: sugar kinase [Ruminococcaceae bacterium]|nr:sugar kinase [Oscillospiraceae bacterium]HBG55636.1 sugar kinase [Oscillospiraceae bacterium]HBT90291.1 sugar kinase [Oscillospiraceae bacterium]HCB91128.1 sugar kinase [Oscillospiraceae bacterium]